MADESRNTNDVKPSGILGMRDKLGLMKKPLKKTPPARQLTLQGIPQLPEMVMQQRKLNNDLAPGGAPMPEEGPGINKMKNRVARSRMGGNKQELFNA